MACGPFLDATFARNAWKNRLGNDMTNETLEARTFKRWQIGDARVTRVVEVDTFAVPPDLLFQIDAESVKRHSWLLPDFATEDGRVLLSIQAFIIEVDGLRIMVDPCLGNDKSRDLEMYNMRDGPFLEHLESAGFPCESIDIVLCTHLHFDHVGWNTRLIDGRWIPTFPNARYLFAQAEFDHARTDTTPNAQTTFEDSIKPILDAGLADFVEMDHRLSDQVWLEPTPGHTPGHCSVRISSRGEEAVITGDMMHHPVQACEPDVCTHVCSDMALARATRRTFLGRQAADGTMVLGSHFSGPTGMRVLSDGAAWRMEPA